MRAILDGRRNRRGFSRPVAVMTMILCAGLLAPVAALRGQEAPDAPSQAQPQSAPQAAPQPTRGGAISGRSATGGRGGGAGGRGGFGGGGFVSGGIGNGPEPLGGMAAWPAPGSDTGPTCSLDATIYEVQLDADKIGQIDVDDLTKYASSAATFEKALGEYRSSVTKPLYRTHQSVRLSGDLITISTQVPYVTNSQVSNTGSTVNTVAYREVGASFNVSGKARDDTAMDLELGIHLSVMGENGVAITDKVNAPVFRSTTMSHEGRVTPGQPFVVMSIDAASNEGRAVVYIARVTIGKPEFPSSAATSNNP